MTKKQKQIRKLERKLDRAWSDEIRKVGACEIYGKKGTPRQDGKMIVGLHAHHLIPKNTPLWRQKWRWDLSNGICLCESCHSKFQTALGPHGDTIAVKNFWDWMGANRSGQLEWVRSVENDKTPPNFTVEYLENLLQELENEM